MHWKEKFYKILDKDLMTEMFVDLTSIYVGLYVIYIVGFMLLPNGWMSMWMWFIDLADGDAHLMYVVGNLMVLLVVYWVPVTLYTLADVFKPKFIYQYKVQREEVQVEITLKVLSEVVGRVLCNQIVQTLIGSEIAWRLRYIYINMDEPLTQVPTFNRMMIEISMFLVIFEIMFYYSHVLLHTKKFFKFHKIHHDWKTSIAAATANGHPVDFLLHCVLAVAMGPVVVRSHLSTAWVWYLVITLHELNDHSGYHFPWMRSSQAHDYHHKVGHGNYGNWCRLLDVFNGTDARYKKSGVAWERHRRILGLDPAHILYPETMN